MTTLKKVIRYPTDSLIEFSMSNILKSGVAAVALAAGVSGCEEVRVTNLNKTIEAAQFAAPDLEIRNNTEAFHSALSMQFHIVGAALVENNRELETRTKGITYLKMAAANNTYDREAAPYGKVTELASLGTIFAQDEYQWALQCQGDFLTQRDKINPRAMNRRYGTPVDCKQEYKNLAGVLSFADKATRDSFASRIDPVTRKPAFVQLLRELNYREGVSAQERVSDFRLAKEICEDLGDSLPPERFGSFEIRDTTYDYIRNPHLPKNLGVKSKAELCHQVDQYGEIIPQKKNVKDEKGQGELCLEVIAAGNERDEAIAKYSAQLAATLSIDVRANKEYWAKILSLIEAGKLLEKMQKDTAILEGTKCDTLPMGESI